MTQAYPLQWPQARPRTSGGSRKRASFNKKHVPVGKAHTVTSELTVADAVGRLQREIDLLGATTYVLSTNLALRLDGLPRSGQAEPEDPGAALYFRIGGRDHCLPCDTYDRIADNIAAIAKHIEATRAIERYGVASMSEMFAGFVALPAPAAKRTWRDILEIRYGSVTESDVTIEYRKRAKEWTAAGRDLTDLNVARDDALAELRQ